MFFLFIKTFKVTRKFIISLSFLLISIILTTFIVSFANENKNSQKEEKKDFIKWVDFNVSSEVLLLTSKLDIDSHNNDQDIKYNWIELLAYLACKNGGNFKNFDKKCFENLTFFNYFPRLWTTFKNFWTHSRGRGGG